MDDEDRFISSFLNISKAHHCTGFMATGGATTEGQIVATQATWFGSTSWWFNAYIAERWNVIVDLQPTEGNRVLFSTAPGYIWSDENYYQNQEGIVILDTTAPQGLWARRGVPLAVRSRMAAQYGGSIDEVIAYLLEGNDGVWTAVWLIGDTKTGEIARMDLGLYNHGIWRTHDGSYWSANNIMDERVRAERRLGSLKGRFLQLLNIVYPTTGWYEYYTREYHPNPRDILFEELGTTYYGAIDVDWMKNIMSDSPFTDFSSDTKVSDSYLIDQNGLWVHWGNPGGIVWNTTIIDDVMPGGTVFPPAGWVCLYGLPTTYDYVPVYRRGDDRVGSPVVFWQQKTRDDSPLNTCFTYNTVSEENVYVVSSTGAVQCFDISTGRQHWIQELGGSSVGPLVCRNNFLAVGLRDFLYVLNKTNGEIIWKKPLECLGSPVIVKDDIVVGCENKAVSYNLASGQQNWVCDTPGGAYPSPVWNNKIFIGTGSMVWALDSTSGRVEWTFDTHGPLTTPPCVDTEGGVYVGSWDTYLYALDAKTGRQKWVFPMGWGLSVPPVIKDDTLFLGSLDNNFYSLDTSQGDLLWSFVCHSGIQSVPLVYGDSVFFGCDDGYFYVLNRTTGKIRWQFSPGYSHTDDQYNYVTTPLHSNPVAYNGTVFLGVQRILYALDAQTWETEDNQEKDAGDLALFSEIPYLFIVLIVVIGCIVLLPAIFTYRNKKKKQK
jgi:outer membrane protein assembly factor BamB